MSDVSFWELLFPLWFQQILCDLVSLFVKKTFCHFSFSLSDMHKYYVKNCQWFICDFLSWLTLRLTLQGSFKEKSCCSWVPVCPISLPGHGWSHRGCSSSFQAQAGLPSLSEPCPRALAPAWRNLSCCCGQAWWAPDEIYGSTSQLELGPLASPWPFWWSGLLVDPSSLPRPLLLTSAWVLPCLAPLGSSCPLLLPGSPFLNLF